MQTQKKTHDSNLSTILSLIPKEERILFISERISNKNLAISIRILVLAIISLLLYFLIFLPFNKFFFIEINSPILRILFILVVFGIIIFINYIIGKKYYNIRKDSYIILTHDKIITLLFSIKYKSPVLRKYSLNRFQYFSIQKRLFRESANLILSYNIVIRKVKLKGIKDHVIIQKYLDSIQFHFGKIEKDWLYLAKYSIPLKLVISESVYHQVKKRLKHVSIGFEIATPIIILIGVFVALIVDEIFNNVFDKVMGVILYTFFAIGLYIFFAILYFQVWYQLKRCSSLEAQMIVKSDEIEYNDIKIPLNKSITISAAFLSKWEHTQRTLRPLQNVYCIKINEGLTVNKKKFFGPIEDFQNCFKFIYNHLLDWKNKNGHLFSKEELYKNEIKS